MKCFRQFRETADDMPTLSDMVKKFAQALDSKTHSKETIEKALEDVNPQAIRAVLNWLYLRGHLDKKPNDKFRVAYSGVSLRDVLRSALFEFGLRDK